MIRAFGAALAAVLFATPAMAFVIGVDGYVVQDLKINTTIDAFYYARWPGFDTPYYDGTNESLACDVQCGNITVEVHAVVTGQLPNRIESAQFFYFSYSEGPLFTPDNPFYASSYNEGDGESTVNVYYGNQSDKTSTLTYTDLNPDGYGSDFEGQRYVVTAVSYSYTETFYDWNGAVVSPVPEPETWAMLMVGMAALGWKERRRVSIRTQ